jgi:hypothetical protein
MKLHVMGNPVVRLLLDTGTDLQSRTTGLTPQHHHGRTPQQPARSHLQVAAVRNE